MNALVILGKSVNVASFKKTFFYIIRWIILLVCYCPSNAGRLQMRLTEKGSSPKSVQTLTFYRVLSICFLSAYPVGLEPNSAFTGWESGYIVDRSPGLTQRNTTIHTHVQHSVESPVTLMHMWTVEGENMQSINFSSSILNVSILFTFVVSFLDLSVFILVKMFLHSNFNVD